MTLGRHKTTSINQRKVAEVQAQDSELYSRLLMAVHLNLRKSSTSVRLKAVWLPAADVLEGGAICVAVPLEEKVTLDGATGRKEG